MANDLKQLMDKVDNLKKNNTNQSDSLQSLSNELNNIKILVSPVELDISNDASTFNSTMSAMIKCTFSIAPGIYIGTKVTTLSGNMPSSNILDTTAFENILPFVGCINYINPFAPAQLGVPPFPCMPTLSPFVPTEPTVLLDNMPISTSDAIAFCMFAVGGVVEFETPGQENVQV